MSFFLCTRNRSSHCPKQLTWNYCSTMWASCPNELFTNEFFASKYSFSRHPDREDTSLWGGEVFNHFESRRALPESTNMLQWTLCKPPRRFQANMSRLYGIKGIGRDNIYRIMFHLGLVDTRKSTGTSILLISIKEHWNKCSSDINLVFISNKIW